MPGQILTVREIQTSDIPHITDYWLNASEEYLHGMGAEKTKVPIREEWHKMLSAQVTQPYSEKGSYCMIWELDGKPIGHCNVNRIAFGQQAHMHLHSWYAVERQQGLGIQFVKMALPYFFKNLELKELYCEPYALNPAPNRLLEKTGFELLKEYTTTPGWINFEQPVKLWRMSYEKFLSL